MAKKGYFIKSESFDYNKYNDLTSSFSTNYEYFENQYNTFFEDLYDEKELLLPATIFSSSMGSLQAIVKYLKEVKNLKLSEIANLIDRDQRTVWNVYNKVKKNSLNEDLSESNIFIPLSIIKNRKLSVLENIILFLKNKGLSFTEIAILLQRNYQTIYTTHRKTKRRENE